MKWTRKKREQGSILIMTLVVAISIGFALASYLNMVSEQNKSVMRSLQWNSSLPLLEAGIEEAMAHIRKANMVDMESDDWDATENIYINEERIVEGSFYRKRRKFGDGNYYEVYVTKESPPTIYSVGYVRDPIKQEYIPPRLVRATTIRDGMFTKGMIAKGRIDLNGQNITTDSFDSMDPSSSTNGRYDPAKFRDNGDVASNSTITGIINQGNADIYGRVSTGPGGSVTVGPNGAVGTKAWIEAGNNGIQSGRFSDDMNVSFPDVSAPFSAAPSPTPGTPIVINSSGNYQITDLASTLIVSSNTHAVLKVNRSISLTGTKSIQIQPGASLQIYMHGAIANISGNGVVNWSGNATNFMYWGATNNVSLTISGNGEFVGAIYAPNANFRLGGGGNSAQDFVGASVTSTVTMNGHFKFHYDENLGRVGPSRGFIITSWNEL